MFTGIVNCIGAVTAAGIDAARRQLGDSVAVAGVCLTVAGLTPRGFSADVSRETLAHTTIANWRAGQHVNLEAALRAGDLLGGHLVAGHVDGCAELLERSGDARSQRLRFRVPEALRRYLARKGSVTLDGVSLTVNEVDGAAFGVNLIPHTLQVTTLGDLQPGAQLNLEVDLMARYAERLLAPN
jgi:riboflavin synthase